MYMFVWNCVCGEIHTMSWTLMWVSLPRGHCPHDGLMSNPWCLGTTQLQALPKERAWSCKFKSRNLTSFNVKTLSMFPSKLWHPMEGINSIMDGWKSLNISYGVRRYPRYLACSVHSRPQHVSLVGLGLPCAFLIYFMVVLVIKARALDSPKRRPQQAHWLII